MSFIPDGGANVFVAANTSVPVWFWWYSSGWQGNTFVEAQPHNTDAFLVCVPGIIELSVNGNYYFQTTVVNNGPNDTFFDMQVSSE